MQTRHSTFTSEALKQAAKDIIRYHPRRIPLSSKASTQEESALLVSGGILGMVGGLLVYIGILIGMIGDEAPNFLFIGTIGAAVACWVAAGALSKIARAKAPTRLAAHKDALKYHRAIHLLVNSTDLEAIGPLTEILWLSDISNYIPTALVRLLPQLRSEHTTLLSNRQRDCLYRILTDPNPTSQELQMAALKAIEQIGDNRALRIIEQLAKGVAVSTKLHLEAVICLRNLQERLQPGSLGRKLLRASNEPITAQNMLLRPATENPASNSQELLRTSD